MNAFKYTGSLKKHLSAFLICLISFATLSPIIAELVEDSFNDLKIIQNDNWFGEESSSEEKNEIEESKKTFDSDFTFTISVLRTDKFTSRTHHRFQHIFETPYQEVNVPPPDCLV